MFFYLLKRIKMRSSDVEFQAKLRHKLLMVTLWFYVYVYTFVHV